MPTTNFGLAICVCGAVLLLVCAKENIDKMLSVMVNIKAVFRMENINFDKDIKYEFLKRLSK